MDFDRDKLNNLSKEILDACICVHKEIGPGLLESVYEYALLKEFEIRNIKAVNRIGLELFIKDYLLESYTRLIFLSKMK